MIKKDAISDIKRQKGILLTIASSSEYLNGQYYKVGAQGLLDFALTQGAGKDIKAIIGQLSATDLTDKNIYSHLKKIVDNIHFEKTPLLESELSKFEGEAQKPYKYDLSKFKNYDYVVLLGIRSFGASRRFWSVIPTGAPQGDAYLSLIVVNPKNNEIMAKVNSHKTIPSETPWKQIPEYVNLKQASELAFKEASSELIQTVFK